MITIEIISVFFLSEIIGCPVNHFKTEEKSKKIKAKNSEYLKI